MSDWTGPFPAPEVVGGGGSGGFAIPSDGSITALDQFDQSSVTAVLVVDTAASLPAPSTWVFAYVQDTFVYYVSNGSTYELAGPLNQVNIDVGYPRLWASASGTYKAGTDAAVTINAEVADPYGWIDTGTATDRFITITTGLYFAWFDITFAAPLASAAIFFVKDSLGTVISRQTIPVGAEFHQVNFMIDASSGQIAADGEMVFTMTSASDATFVGSIARNGV